jgi:two-component system KDP operon response regulator KdpE
MPKVLIVDDDEQLVGLLSLTLKKEGYDVACCYTCEDAQENLKISQYDLLILDVGLPDGNGFTLCSQYRSRGLTAPILMLTGESDERSKEKGLDAGADDYLTKPFGMRELLARLRALTRRAQTFAPQVANLGLITIDFSNKRVFNKSREVRLQNMDYKLLELLSKNPGRLFTHEALLTQVWGTYTESGVESLRTAIKRIRKEIDQDGAESLIETVHRVGYVFKPIDHA